MIFYFSRYSVSIKNPKPLTQKELEEIAQKMFDSDQSDEDIGAHKIFEEENSEQEVGGESDEDGVQENPNIIYSEHDSNSEQEGSENELPSQDGTNNNTTSDVPSRDPLFLAKDNTLWKKHPVVKINSKTSAKNKAKVESKPTVSKDDVYTEETAFIQFFSNNMIEEIVRCTNSFIRTIQESFSRERDAKETTKQEFLAFIGLLYLCGVKKQNHTSFEELWSNDGTGTEIFRACMSSRRFLFLLRAVRLDEKRTRIERLQTDKLAPVRYILDNFVSNCRKSYCVGQFMTIDEMLVPFKGRCNFIQYIPNKPAKYGLKVFALCDSETFYTANLEVYCGQQPEGPYKKSNSPTDIVHRLVEPYKGKNRNLTCDNWYTNYPLAKSLLKDHITLVGTLKKNKREIPIELLPYKARPVKSSIFAFQKDVTLVSYSAKKNKAVVLLSTMHDDDKLDSKTEKPDIVMFYNSTKGGIDCVDQMCGNYSVSKRTRRWPLVIFFQLLNIGGLNANILYNTLHPSQKRRIFMKNLSLSLMKPHLESRAQIQNLPMDVKLFLSRYKHFVEHQNEEPEEKTRGRCVLCERKKNRVTTIKCSTCRRMACKEHVVTIHKCHDCTKAEVGIENTTP